jgi:RNA polymerase sigma factor (sigma-70 family)
LGGGSINTGTSLPHQRVSTVNHPKPTLLSELHRLFGAESAARLLDGQLLDGFKTTQEQVAFATLVRRHGPMVLNVCRRVLHNDSDADDTFQATFLILARKAGGIGKRQALAAWLHKVAYRVALQSRADRAARQGHEQEAPARLGEDPLAAITARELLTVLDEELLGLPERLRAPLILCYLEEQTQENAAKFLRLSERTLRRRLEQGREALRRRLERRGLALPAAFLAAATLQRSAEAALPALLVSSTVKAAVRAAAGDTLATVTSVHTAKLAAGTLKAMAVGKVSKVAVAAITVALVGSGMSIFAFRGMGSGSELQSQAERTAEAPRIRGKQPDPSRNNWNPMKPAVADNQGVEVTFAGRVVDADGKSVSNVDVGVIFTCKDSGRGGDLFHKLETLGPVKTDNDGRFRLPPKQLNWEAYRQVQLVASADGHGLAWKDLYAEGSKEELVVAMPLERIVEGRLVDLQGQGAAGVAVHLFTVAKQAPGELIGVQVWDHTNQLPVWPAAVTTDREGRFTFRRLGADSGIAFQVFDERFARQILPHFQNNADAANEMTTTLAPAKIIEGEVIAADTGKPLPNARLTVYSTVSESISSIGFSARADEKGRFRVNPLPGSQFSLTAYPPEGTPYLVAEKSLKWPPGTVKQQLNIAVPRGVLIRGKVTESASGKPVARAKVEYLPKDEPDEAVTGWQATVISASDGSFQMALPKGSGHLAFLGPTADYVQIEVQSNKLYGDKPGGQRYYAHAWAPITVNAEAAKELQVNLRRGVTVKGKLVDSEGKSVADALIISRVTSRVYSPQVPRISSLQVRGGQFELRGLDPQEVYTVFFLDPKNKQGVVAQVAGKDAGAEPITVRLAPCGSATVRYVGEDGKPFVGMSNYSLQMVIQPGVSPFERELVMKKDALLADADFVANLDRLNHWEKRPTDADGRLTIPALIPGATYRFLSGGGDFQVESGKTLQLPEIVYKKEP